MNLKTRDIKDKSIQKGDMRGVPVRWGAVQEGDAQISLLKRLTKTTGEKKSAEIRAAAERTQMQTSKNGP